MCVCEEKNIIKVDIYTFRESNTTNFPSLPFSVDGGRGDPLLKELKRKDFAPITVELQWLEHLWDYENSFETGVVRAIEGLL